MGTISKLSVTNPIARRVMDAYNPDQERDERGRWGTGGPGSGAETKAARVGKSQPSALERTAAMHEKAGDEHEKAGRIGDALASFKKAGMSYRNAGNHTKASELQARHTDLKIASRPR